MDVLLPSSLDGLEMIVIALWLAASLAFGVVWALTGLALGKPERRGSIHGGGPSADPSLGEAHRLPAHDTAGL